MRAGSDWIAELLVYDTTIPRIDLGEGMVCIEYMGVLQGEHGDEDWLRGLPDPFETASRGLTGCERYRSNDTRGEQTVCNMLPPCSYFFNRTTIVCTWLGFLIFYAQWDTPRSAGPVMRIPKARRMNAPPVRVDRERVE